MSLGTILIIVLILILISYHRFDSYPDRRHSHMGPQPRVGLWSFGINRCRARRRTYIVFAGKNLGTAGAKPSLSRTFGRERKKERKAAQAVPPLEQRLPRQLGI
jgi:hypothetical protein